MKIGVISDIHGNVAGLEAALGLMGDVDELLCLGDCVSQVRFSNEVMTILKQRGARLVLGNHDVDYLNRLAAAQAAKGVVDAALVDWLRNQPEQLDLEIAGKRVLMVHSTPWTRDYVYPGSKEMERFAEVAADFVLGGHTHALFSGRFGRAMVINPGSAGQSRYHEGASVLTCATFDPQTDEVNLIQYPEPLVCFE